MVISYSKTNRMRLPDSKLQILPAYQPRLKRVATGKLLIRTSVMNTSITTINHKSSNDLRWTQSEMIAAALNSAMNAATPYQKLEKFVASIMNLGRSAC